MAIDITDGALLGNGEMVGEFNIYRFVHEVANDKYFTTEAFEFIGTITGEYNDGIFSKSCTMRGTGTIDGDWVESLVVDGTLDFFGELRGEGVMHLPTRNWIAWSKIGELSFAVDRTNDAGARPMPWKGNVYQLLPADKSFIIYGENGITLMTPVVASAQLNLPPTFGMKPLANFGIKGKYAAVSDGVKNWFIDVIGRLWEISTDGLKPIGYEEFFNPMSSSLVMNYDALYQRLYITDGTYGYVYSASGLGGCPSNLTSIGRDGSNFRTLFTSSNGHSIISQADFELKTTIIDCGYPDSKFLQKVIVDCNDDPTDLECRVAYDPSGSDGWSYTNWMQLNARGEYFGTCSGALFQIELRKSSSTLVAVPVSQINDISLHVDLADIVFNREESRK